MGVSFIGVNRMKLTIELVPKTCWYTNVRSHVSKAEWDKLRRETYRRANYCCEVCDGRGPRHPVEAHEIFSYNDDSHIQKLERLIALCPACHQVKHIGLASMQGRGEEAIAHLIKVNGWQQSQAERYVEQCFQTWRTRSQHQWQLDLSELKTY